MAWKDGFVLEYVDPENGHHKGRRLSCRKCAHFDKGTACCEVRGYPLSDLGYDAWKKCEWFDFASGYNDEVHQKALDKQRGIAERASKGGRAKKHVANEEEHNRQRRLNEILEADLHAGDKVMSRKRGEGTIVSIGKGKMRAKFRDGQVVVFAYPDVFVNKALSIVPRGSSGIETNTVPFDEIARRQKQDAQKTSRNGSQARKGEVEAAFRRDDSRYASLRFDVGKCVHHVRYGFGKVVERSNGKIRVKFASCTVWFSQDKLDYGPDWR